MQYGLLPPAAGTPARMPQITAIRPCFMA